MQQQAGRSRFSRPELIQRRFQSLLGLVVEREGELVSQPVPGLGQTG